MLWDEWASVLELSCMWQMSKVREMAVQEILRLHKQAGTECQKVLLKLSNRLGIREIRDAVIRALSRALGPVEQIQLGTELVMCWAGLQALSPLSRARPSPSQAQP